MMMLWVAEMSMLPASRRRLYACHSDSVDAMLPITRQRVIMSYCHARARRRRSSIAIS